MNSASSRDIFPSLSDGMDLIVAVSADWGIGRENQLLFSLPTDMKFFREKTKGATVVMGRSTLLSFPGGKPLKGRENWVLSTNPAFSPDGVTVFRSVEELLPALCGKEHVFVIGGESVYRLLLPYCKRAFVTKVDAQAEADRFFPNLDEAPSWQKESESERQKENGLSFTFVSYTNQNPKA